MGKGAIINRGVAGDMLIGLLACTIERKTTVHDQFHLINHRGQLGSGVGRLTRLYLSYLDLDELFWSRGDMYV